MATEKMTIAETWLRKIDKPMTVGGFDAGINRKAVGRMKDAAEDVIQNGSPRCTDIFVFADGSGLERSGGRALMRPLRSSLLKTSSRLKGRTFPPGVIRFSLFPTLTNGQ
jgi:hypothetical protein